MVNGEFFHIYHSKFTIYHSPFTIQKKMFIDEFPEAGTEYQGGMSDGWEYRTVFAGGTLERSLEMVRQFLQEEGLGELPIPANATEMRLFKLPKNRQTALFMESGYAHNPIKILFPTVGKRSRAALILCIYNASVPNHLVKFHGVDVPRSSASE
jgi:hypothetical protein